MIVKKISLSNWLGIDEKEIDLGHVNLVSGPNGSGKTSLVEAIEKGFTNKSRRTEVIRHGSNEARIYIETDNGLEIERKIRNNKADYLKLRKGDEGIPSTEKYLRDLINGNIFRPLDWVNMSSKEQTKSILNMLKIDWSQEDIKKWFGEIPSNVEYSQHILMVLKAIETKYYQDREETNRQIKELKAQIQVIKKDLPTDYDGEKWRNLKVQEYYNKVSEAQKINQYIEQAKALQEGFENKVAAIKANAESDKSRVSMNYKDKRQDIKDIISLSNSKIEKAKDIISKTDEKVELELSKLDAELDKEYQKLLEKYTQLKDEKAKEIQAQADEQKDLINIQNNKIAQKTEELNSLDSLEKQELKAVDTKIESEIEKEKIRVGKAAEYLQNNKSVDVEPLQKQADEVAENQTYIRQWDRMLDIQNGELAERERDSAVLTSQIETARKLPQELIKKAQMPIEGISVDENGLIRIDGTLIDGLSDGEKLELAFKIAKTQCGELKLICIDKFDDLNPKEKEKVKQMAIDDKDYEYIILSSDSDTFNIQKLD